MAIPPTEGLRQLITALQAAGVEVALGGSGLLYSLGLVDSVRDWDLTTDEPLEAVTPALAGFAWRPSLHGDGLYRSAFRLAVDVSGAEVDLIGRFTVGDVHLPTIPVARWEGIPVGSPEVWAVAYRLIERHEKADLLHNHLRTHGARTFVVQKLLQQGLNPNIRRELDTWPLIMS